MDNCCADGCWIPDLARIAGLWARANDMARPLGYYGPVFPPVTAAAPLKHLAALTEDFPRASQPPRRCPCHDKGLGRLLRKLIVLAVEAALWAAAMLVLGPGTDGQSAAGLALAGTVSSL